MTLPELRASLLLLQRRRPGVSRRLESAVLKNEPGLIAKRRQHLLEIDRKIARRELQIQNAGRTGVKAGTLWLPNAKRVRGKDCGPFVAAAPKLLWHTTEGSTAEGALGAYRATGSFPHFTFTPLTGALLQHVPLNRGARALEHPAGTVETNRAHVIQVELVGNAASTPSWPDAAYARIAALARDIEAAVGIRRHAMATFSGSAGRLGADTWLHEGGHCGHEHAPNNNHTDPGGFKIAKIL